MSVLHKVESASASYEFMVGAPGVGEDLLYMKYDPGAELLGVTVGMPGNKHRVDILNVAGAGAPVLDSSFEAIRCKPELLGFVGGRLMYSAYHHVVICERDGTTVEEIPVVQVEAAHVMVDGRLLFNKHELVLWGDGGAREFEDKHAYMVCSVSASPDGKFAVSTGFEPYVRLWDVASGTQLKRVTVSSGGACYAAFSPEGGVVAYGGDKDKATGAMSLRLLNVDKKWSLRSSLALPSLARVFGLGFSADGARLWVSQHDVGAGPGMISVWDWRVGACLHTIEIPGASAHSQYARAVATSADGKRVFVGLPVPAARVLVFETP